MIRTSAIALALLSAATLVATNGAPAFARTTTLYMSQLGSGSDSDKGTAHSQALQDATDRLNNICIGTMVNIEETSVVYIPIGSGDNLVYNATVFAKGQCQITTRN